MKIITNHFCNYTALDLLTKCHSMLIIINKYNNNLKKQHCPVYSKIALYKGQIFR